MKLSQSTRQLLRCPACGDNLDEVQGRLRCRGQSCQVSYPVVAGTPVLINEARGIYSIEEVVARSEARSNATPSWVRAAFGRALPGIGLNTVARSNYEQFARLLAGRQGTARVLVIGGGILGQGMEVLTDHAAIELVETDIAFGPRTLLICDAHDIPFEDASFDGVVAQAVLEHVLDPYRCVDELHRVLKPGGAIYAEVPFMQQVHEGAHDFTRFTHLGLRRLFRRFDEVDSGAACGPGMALAWAYEYLLMSFFGSHTLRTAARIFGRLTSFYLKYLDFFLVSRDQALDAASACYFLGTRSEKTLLDKMLIAGYRGAT